MKPIHIKMNLLKVYYFGFFQEVIQDYAEDFEEDVEEFSNGNGEYKFYLYNSSLCVRVQWCFATLIWRVISNPNFVLKTIF